MWGVDTGNQHQVQLGLVGSASWAVQPTQGPSGLSLGDISISDYFPTCAPILYQVSGTSGSVEITSTATGSIDSALQATTTATGFTGSLFKGTTVAGASGNLMLLQRGATDILQV